MGYTCSIVGGLTLFSYPYIENCINTNYFVENLSMPKSHYMSQKVSVFLMTFMWLGVKKMFLWLKQDHCRQF